MSHLESRASPVRSCWEPPSTIADQACVMEDGAPDDPPSWIERFDPQAQLDVLAAALADDLRGQVTNVAIARAGRRLTLSYHQIVVLCWKVSGRDLVCIPLGWRRKTYTATGPVHARAITIRLVFEFVRQFQGPRTPS